MSIPPTARDGATTPGTFALQVDGLMIPRSWRVGRVMFQPREWMMERLSVMIDEWEQDAGSEWANGERKRLDESPRWAAAIIDADDKDEARDRVRESVAVLRLFQQEHWPREDTDLQTFGLGSDIAWLGSQYWPMHGEKVTGTAGRRDGAVADWRMGPEDHEAFVTDALYVFLDEALRVDEPGRTPLQRRALAAVVLHGANTRMLPRPARMVLLTAAIEALLGDKPGPAQKVIRRALYVTCRTGPDEVFHGPERGPCPYLAETSKDVVKGLVDARPGPGCLWYGYLSALFEARNAVAHRGRTALDKGDIDRGRWVVRDVLVHALRWAVAHDEVPVAAVDAELRALGAG